jgi:hypothetical protein
MAFLNIPYGEDAVRRAMRGMTPPFLPEGPAPPALDTPQMPPPPLSTPVYGDVRDELARADELEASRPKPGFWRKLGSAALGAAAGYANQDPKLQQPIDPTAAQDFILYGDHSQKVAEQQGRIGRAKEAATIAEKEARLAADLESERARKASYEATAEARRASMNQPPKLPAPPSTYEARLVRDLDSPDPAVREAAQKKLDALKAPAPPKLTTPIPGRDVPYSPEVEAQRRRMAAAGRAPRESGDRPASPAAFRIIESEKARNLRAAERDARNRIADGEDEKVVYTDLESQKDEIQNAYEAQIVAAGGSIAPQAPKPAPTPQPTPQPAPQQTPKQLTVEKAAEYLRKAGGNKDLAREMARKDGWNF